MIEIVAKAETLQSPNGGPNSQRHASGDSWICPYYIFY